MPKGGEERAREPRGPRGAIPVWLPPSQPPGVSESGAEGECPCRLRARPRPQRRIVRMGRLRTIVASNHSLGGLRRLGGSGSSPTQKARPRARFSPRAGAGAGVSGAFSILGSPDTESPCPAPVQRPLASCVKRGPSRALGERGLPSET